MFCAPAASRFRTDDASGGMIRGAICGSGLAHDAGSAVFQSNRVDAIASKPAPTEGGGEAFCSGLARGLDHHLDQWYQASGQADPA